MKAMAASCSCSRTLVLSYFDPLHAADEFSGTGIGGSTRSLAGIRARMLSGARPDNALFQGELVPG